MPHVAAMRGFRPSHTLDDFWCVNLRAYELHASAKQVQRSKGRSSVAAAAYRSAQRLVDERTGEIHDYTKKQGVEHSRVYVPDHAPEWAQDRATLWNACEAKENRSNSCTARELEIGFPSEFNAMQRREAGDKICQQLMERYGCAVDICYHAPNRDGDERNHHAHIMFTTRGFDENSKDGWQRTKYRDLNNDKLEIDGRKTTRGKEEIRSLREFTAEQMNLIAERDRLNVRTEYLSFEERGIDREPTQHLGAVANGMERSGKTSRIGDKNRQIANDNERRADLHIEAAKLTLEIDNTKSKFDQWKERKAEEIAHAQELNNLDLSQAHDRQKSRLDAHLEKTYGTAKATAKAQLDAVERRLEAKGVRKVLRAVFGQSKTDQKTREDLKATLKDIEKREAEQRGRLARQQALELKKVAERQERRREGFVRSADRAKARREKYPLRNDRKARKGEREKSASPSPESRKVAPAPLKSLDAPDLADQKRMNTREMSDIERKAPDIKKPWHSSSREGGRKPWHENAREGERTRTPRPSPSGSGGGSKGGGGGKT